jgi:hypothetical protein
MSGNWLKGQGYHLGSVMHTWLTLRTHCVCLTSQPQVITLALSPVTKFIIAVMDFVEIKEKEGASSEPDISSCCNRGKQKPWLRRPRVQDPSRCQKEGM